MPSAPALHLWRRPWAWGVAATVLVAAAAVGAFALLPRAVRTTTGIDLGSLPRGVSRDRLNLLVVTLDTTRSDRVGAYGANVATPAFDRLAREGVLFEQAEAVAPLTLPAHTSIFSGRFPPEHGVRDNGGFVLDFSPDGQFLAADTANGLFLWKVSDGTQLMGGNPGPNSEAAAFSPDGRFLVYSEIGDGTSIVLTSPDGAEKIHTIQGDLRPIWGLDFSLDGSLLVAYGVVTQIWRVEGWQLLLVGKGECP